MSWKDYEKLDGSKEFVTEEEWEELVKKHGLSKVKRERSPFDTINKRGRADIFKKKYS